MEMQAAAPHLAEHAQHVGDEHHEHTIEGTSSIHIEKLQVCNI